MAVLVMVARAPQKDVKASCHVKLALVAAGLVVVIVVMVAAQEVRFLHLEVGASFGGGCSGGTIWSAIVRKACPRLEVAEARLSCEALNKVALCLMKEHHAANAAAGDTTSSSSTPPLPSSSTTAAASSLSCITAGPVSSSSPPVQLQAVKRLHFTGGKLNHEDLESFAVAVQKGALPFLEELHVEITSGELSSAISLCEALPDMPHLRPLGLPWVTDKSIEALAQVLRADALPRLHSLTLSARNEIGSPIPISDSAFLVFTAALTEGAGSMLQNINCRFLHIGPTALGAFAWTLSSTGCPLLRTLHLPATHFGRISGAVAVGVLQASSRGRRIKLMR